MYLIDNGIVVYALKGDPNVLNHRHRTAVQPKAVSLRFPGRIQALTYECSSRLPRGRGRGTLGWVAVGHFVAHDAVLAPRRSSRAANSIILNPR